MSPTLYSINREELINEALKVIVLIGGERITVIKHTDDHVVLAISDKNLKKMIRIVVQTIS